MPRNTLHKSTKGVTYIDTSDIIGPKIIGIPISQRVDGTSIKLPPNTKLYSCGDNRLKLGIADYIINRYKRQPKTGLFKMYADPYTFAEVRQKAIEQCGSRQMKDLLSNDDMFRSLLYDLLERVKREHNEEDVGEYTSTKLAWKYFKEDIYLQSLEASYRHTINSVCDIISIYSGFRVNLTSKNKSDNGYFLFGNRDGKPSEAEYNKFMCFIKQLEAVDKISSNSLARKLDVENLCFKDELRS